MRLLLVDDDQVDRMTVKRLLKKSGLEIVVTTVDTGYKAIEKMQSEHFDLVLLDFNLPDLTGLEVLQYFNKGGIGETAVVFLSSHEDPALAEQCLESGAQDFLLKQDVSPTNLNKAIIHSKLRHENELELDRHRKEMQDLAEHDQLTGLLNRYAFERRINNTRFIHKRFNSYLSLMLLDLDNFKWINDTYGHDHGDLVLIEVAKRLASISRSEDLLCRLGGDEFALAVVNKEKDYSYVAAKRISDLLKVPMQFKGITVNVECSIGIADFSEKKDGLQEVLKKADLAMYKAKDDGRNCFHYFSEVLQEAAERRITIESELRNAIKKQEFVVFYQPQISTESKHIVGVEALVRWQHPVRGLIGPSEFLDVAEDSGLILEIDELVMKQACKQRMDWQKTMTSLGDFKVAINISARQLKSARFLESVKETLTLYKIDPCLIEFEIVESELVQDFESADRVISELREIGIDMAIDDFGTGYSSLSYLKQLRVQTLKVDRSFLKDVPHNELACRLMKGLINLGQSMQLNIVVEGVENVKHLEKCEEFHAEIVQGYLFSKPLNSDDFYTYCEQYNLKHPVELKPLH